MPAVCTSSTSCWPTYSHSAERELAADYPTRANGKAASRHAMDEAIGYVYDALAALESLPDSEANRRRRIALVFDQTWEFHWTHRHHEFHELPLRHEPLVVELGDPVLLARLYAQLAHRQLTFGDYGAALALAARWKRATPATAPRRHAPRPWRTEPRAGRT